MGQQPNVEIDPSDLPRPVPDTDPPRRWRPTRPGVIVSPDQMPWGGAFGTPGPDTGYGMKLVREADLPERTDGLESVLAALMAARASLFGRAPVIEDLEVAKLLAGLGEGLPPDLADRRRVQPAQHDHGHCGSGRVDRGECLESAAVGQR